MKIATIGTSWITDSFIKSSEYISDARICAVYSRDISKAEKFAAEHNVTDYYDSLDEMLSNDNIDGVYIASPNYAHYEQAKKCLEAGKHVICEKPATVTKKQLENLYALADSKNLIFLEAMKSMHSDGLGIILDEIKNIGDIRTAHIDFSQLSSKYPAYKRGENPNIFNPELCTGALMDLGVYCVYFALELFGKPVNVVASSAFLESGADYSGTLVFEYEDKTVTLTYSKVANGFVPSKILGEDGAVTVKSVSKLTGISRCYNDGTIKELYPTVDENLVMSKEIDAFIKFAKGENSDYYAYCKQISLDVCAIMEKIRTENKFGF